MSIAVECTTCNKRYSVEDRLRGQMARCTCGQAIAIPTESENNGQHNGATAKSATAQTNGSTPQQAAQVAYAPSPMLATHNRSAFAPVAASAAAQVATWESFEPAERRRRRDFDPLRYLVGLAALAYGFWFPVIAFAMLGFLGLPVAIAAVGYAPFVFIGAVLILIKNRWGPGVTALAMLFGTFFEGYALLIIGLKQFYETASLQLIIVTILVYTLPAIIFIWCAGEEKRRPPGVIN